MPATLRFLLDRAQLADAISGGQQKIVAAREKLEAAGRKAGDIERKMAALSADRGHNPVQIARLHAAAARPHAEFSVAAAALTEAMGEQSRATALAASLFVDPQAVSEALDAASAKCEAFERQIATIILDFDEVERAIDTIPANKWATYPVFQSDTEFNTASFHFTGSVKQFDKETSNDAISILKHRQFVNIYRELTEFTLVQRVFEIGYFQGGMPLFLCDMIETAKVVGIDYTPPNEFLKATIANNHLGDRVKLYGGILQDDVTSTRAILEAEFGDEPVDMIIDDCSHEYPLTKLCFENWFGYLKPGGKYIVEDWGWLHWPGEEWQTPKNYFWGKPSMTNLLFEIIMVVATRPDLIARVDVVSEFCYVVTRGPGLPYKSPIDLEASRLTSGRTFTPL